MWRNFLTTAFRNVQKQPFFAFVNVIGLAVGLTAVIMMFLFIHDELQYDKHHKDSEHIYRLLKHNDKPIPIHYGVFFKYLKGNLSGVEHSTMIKGNSYAVRHEENKFGQQLIGSVDSSFFDIFSFEAVEGDPSKTIRNTNEIVLTQSAASRYFGADDPIGKTIIIDNKYRAVVTSTIKDFPRQSHFRGDGITGIHFTEEVNPSALIHWGNGSFHFYFKLYPGTAPESIAMQIKDSYDKNAEEKYDNMDGLRLQPLEKIHLYSEKVRFEMSPQGSITTVRIFGVSAILILLLACVNFINLSTARASQRFREVGMRKVIGSGKGDLIKQFLVETSIYVVLAVAIALVLAEISLPWFNNLSGKAMTLHVFLEPSLLASSVLFILTLTILAGLYPAFILSSYSPSVVLKGANYSPGQGNKSFGLREVLVVFQFVISVALLSGSLLVQEQLSYIRTTNLGYDKSNRLAIVNPWDQQIVSRFDAMKSSFASIPGVVSTTGTHNIPNEMQNNYGVFQVKGQSTDNHLHAAVISVENNFFRAMKSKIVRGNDFPETLTNQSKDSLNLCIVNESAYKILKQNGTDNPLGKSLSGFWDKLPERKLTGVVEDIHFRSLHDNVKPAVFLVSKSGYPNYILNLIVEYQPGQQHEVVEEIKTRWASLSPEWPIEYKFLDKDFDALYKRESNMAAIMKVFTFIALLISSLGLVALSLLVLQSKVKQIGIRKVLGATEGELIGMFTWRFVKLVLIANVIALPLMWYAAIEWLNTFAYRTEVNILMLFYVFGVSLVISVMVVYYQTMKTARSNPVEALRYE